MHVVLMTCNGVAHEHEHERELELEREREHEREHEREREYGNVVMVWCCILHHELSWNEDWEYDVDDGYHMMVLVILVVWINKFKNL